MKPVAGPATRAADVTLNDTTQLAPPANALFVGTGGNLKVTLADGATVTFKNVPSGTVLPVSALVVWAAGTTAADVIALF
jgi:hypothetical protein